MNIANIGIIVELISFLAVIAAIIFGYIQIKQIRRQRQDLAAVELVRSFQTSDFTVAFRLLHSLPEDISASEFAAKGTEYTDAAWSLGFAYETTGVLVFREVVPLAAVEDLIGGVGITLWKRLSPWVHMVRKEQSQEHIFEWFQWLVERMEERGCNIKEPAHIISKDWKPKI